MYLTYIDESSGPASFTLGCVFLKADQWPSVFDEVLDFRRFLKARFGIPVRAEIKANYLLHNKGPFRQCPLSESARHAVYRAHMRLQPKVGLQSFGVVIRRQGLAQKNPTLDARHVAWEYLIQRLESLTRKGSTHALIIHDEGEGGLARKLVRKARRIGTAGSAFGTGSLKRPADRIIDDPVPRKSHESFFIQFADLVAYAAFRRVFPPSPRTIQVVPETMWDELGTARFAPVNQLAGGHDGIVAWP
jgi:hypothetical protein